MRVETLEQVAELLGWSEARLAQARDRVADPRPSKASEGDPARTGARSAAGGETHRGSGEDS